MIPLGIEDKYEVISVLQETAASAVLLVNYKQIGALRILKAIHKASPNANSILSEAHLLQGIKSSHIPTIYSVDETNEMYYLVEEYIEGIFLREYLSESKLSKEKLLELAIELCHIIELLHTKLEEPVLYRDLKPDHLVLCSDKLKLIDFGISVRKSQSAKAMPLGTKNWAAPEQLKGLPLDERCDIYSIGKVIEFMQINSYAKDDFRLKELVKKATNQSPDKRFDSVRSLKTMLLSLRGLRVNENEEMADLEKKIAVIGGCHGIGTSHIAINLCRYLNKNNITTYYKDVEGDNVHNLWCNLKNPSIKEGVLYHDSFKGIINYGDAIEHYKPPKGLYVLDCGISESHISEADIIIFVTSTCPFKDIQYPQWISDKSVHVIANFSTGWAVRPIAKSIKKKVFILSKNEERIFSAILKNEKVF